MKIKGKKRRIAREEWSIGIGFGNDPVNLGKDSASYSQVLTKDDVTDTKARFVADPFLLEEKGEWYMFFEVLNSYNNLGEIAVARSSDLKKWVYDRIVLKELFHLSYPYLIKHNDRIYMVPETRKAGAIRLYEANDFPYGWEFKQQLAEGDYADPTIFRHQNRWWMYALHGVNALHLFYADDLLGVWQPHPKNPVIPIGMRDTRPAGKPIVHNGRLLRFAQDGVLTYGNNVRAFEVDVLDTENYAEHELPESPIFDAGELGWNSIGMHHMDAHQLNGGEWVASVDGKTIKYYDR